MINGASYNRAATNQIKETQFVTLLSLLEGTAFPNNLLSKQAGLQFYLRGTAQTVLEIIASHGAAITPDDRHYYTSILSGNNAVFESEYTFYTSALSGNNMVFESDYTFYTSDLSGNDTDLKSKRIFYTSKEAKRTFYTS
jgi:hypothetical protein